MEIAPATGCCPEKKVEPRKPVATVEFTEPPTGFKPGDEVTVTIKGKLMFMEAGKRWSGESDYDKLVNGELRLEVAEVKVASKSNEFSELAEDD